MITIVIIIIIISTVAIIVINDNRNASKYPQKSNFVSYLAPIEA